MYDRERTQQRPQHCLLSAPLWGPRAFQHQRADARLAVPRALPWDSGLRPILRPHSWNAARRWIGLRIGF